MPLYQMKAPNGQTYRIPGPEGATDEQIKQEILRQYPEAAGKPQTRTAAESLGIGVRNIATGLGGMADIVAAPVNTVANAVAGYQRYSRTPYRDVAERTATAIGLPQRGTSGTDLLAQQLIEGATGAALTAGTGIAVQGARGLTGAVGKALAAQPVTGVVAGGLSSVAPEAVRQAGGGPVAQVAAGLTAGMSPFAAAGLAGMAKRAVPNVRPAVTAPEAIIPPSPSQLNTPRIPTEQEMNRFSSVQNVDLASARRGQDVRLFDFAANKQGKYSAPLIKGYGDLPVGVRLENGEVVIFDGNHRVALALGEGKSSIPMNVIEARNFDPENMGRKPAGLPGGMSDDELLAELGGAPIAPKMPPVGAAPEVPPSVATPEQSAEIGALVRKAAMGGIGSTKAREELAGLVKVNPEAKAAADSLGISLPVDVFSDSAIIKEAAGLTRSVQASVAKADWIDTLKAASQRADEVIATLDAKPDVATASANILQNLNDTRTSLLKSAGDLRNEVNAQIPLATPISMPRTREILNQTIEDLGGNRKALTSQENKLLTMIDEADQNPLTYGRLMRERALIGKAIERTESPYGNLDNATLKGLYSAIADDQLLNVERIGGKELRDKMRGSNTLFKQKYALEERIINAFGKEADGSVASLMRNAISAGTKGNIAPLNKLLKAVPKDLQKETIATALMAQTRQKSGEMGFDFNEYYKVYGNLRQNAPVYNKIIKTLGPGSHDLLNGLYIVSKRIAEAKANVLTTGKANQAFLGGMQAEGLVRRVVDNVAGRAVVMGAAATGGPFAAMGASAIQSALSTGGKDVMQEAGKLMSSREFQDLAIKAASGDDVSPVMIKKLVMSERFKNFATAAKLPANAAEREAWVTSALQTGIQAAQPAPIEGPTFEFDDPEMQAAYEASLTQEPPQ